MNARQDWLDARRTGIGGSDIAAILGLSKWKTPLQVYMDKRGEAMETPDNEAMKWGRYLEPVVRQAYSDATGYEVMLPPSMLRHHDYSFAVANLDGVVQDRTGRVFEAKTTRTAEGWGEPGSDQIPQPYLLQVQWYMGVAALPVADVAALIGGSDFRIYTVDADEELQMLMFTAAAEFWQRVQVGDPPDPVSYADAVAMYGKASRTDRVIAVGDVLEAAVHLRDLKAEAKRIEDAEEACKAVIFKALGECDTLVDADGKTLATWRASAAPKRFDAAGFKAAHPALHAEFTREGEPSRRFLIK